MSYHEDHRQEYLEDLKAFLRIPSISTDPDHKVDILRAAEFARSLLEKAGMRNTRLLDAEGRNPLVYGEWLDAPGKPTLLLYGHYDVQPPDPLDEWTSPPFEPEIRNDNIYARGSADDKGQTLILVKAVESLMQQNGRLPINVKFLLEGEEEVGGEHIEEYVKSKPPLLKSDAAVICDTEMFAPELPTICVGLRGMVYGEIWVQGARQDLHSGIYGGAAPNPLQALAEIITTLKDKEGRIHIKGFLDKVEAPSQKEKDAWARLPFNEKEYTEKEIGCKELVGEPGFDVFERTWARPTFEVHGIKGGFIGEGAKTVIPARAIAKVSTRLVANQDPQEALAQIRAAVEAACPKGVTVEFKPIHFAAPSLVNPDNHFIETAAEAMKQVWGKETVYIRSGGSIPIVGVFLDSLGIPSVMMGFGLPDDNLHAPNEKMHLPNFYKGIEAVAKYLEMLGR